VGVVQTTVNDIEIKVDEIKSKVDPQQTPHPHSFPLPVSTRRNGAWRVDPR